VQSWIRRRLNNVLSGTEAVVYILALVGIGFLFGALSALIYLRS
jgi:hypothetical protein